MRTLRFLIFLLTMGILISACSRQSTPATITLTPISAGATVTPSPSPTLEIKDWQTPPAEVLLLYDPTKPPRYLPPPAEFTKTVAERKFQFVNPQGFKFHNTSHGSLMENKDENVMISLELLVHNGKTNTAGFLGIVLDGKMYVATGAPREYDLSGYKGWIIDIESPGIYDNGTGQIIMVDIDSSNLFYAIGLAKQDKWEPDGQQVFSDVINSITFLGFE